MSMEKAAEEAAIKRKFGFIQSVWAERMNLEEGEFEAHELRMKALTDAFQSEFNTVIIYSAESAISFEFREALPRVVSDEVYNPEEEITPHVHSGALPRPLKLLTVMINIRGMMAPGVCTSIGLESQAPEARKEYFNYGCGRCSVQGSGTPQCYRHNKLHRSTGKNKMPNAWRNMAWDSDPDAEYAAISPVEGCACIKIFSGRNGLANAKAHAKVIGMRSLAGAENPCLDSAEHAPSPSKVAFLDHQARVEREIQIQLEKSGGGIMDTTQDEADAIELVALRLKLEQLGTASAGASKDGLTTPAASQMDSSGDEREDYDQAPKKGAASSVKKAFARGDVAADLHELKKQGGVTRDKMRREAADKIADPLWYDGEDGVYMTLDGKTVRRPPEHSNLFTQGATQFGSGGPAAEQQVGGGGPAQQLPTVTFAFPPSLRRRSELGAGNLPGSRRTRASHAQEQQNEQEEQTKYNLLHFNNPHGPNGLAARSKSPFILTPVSYAGTPQLRAMGERFSQVQLTLSELYGRLKDFQSGRFKLWHKGAEALDMAAEFEANRASTDASFATTFNAEVISMLALYSAESSRLLKFIGEIEHHQMLISQDLRLDDALKEFALQHWPLVTEQARQCQFALTHDAGVFGSLLHLVPKPGMSGEGHYLQPPATIGDNELDLRDLMGYYDCSRAALLSQSGADLHKMSQTLRSLPVDAFTAAGVAESEQVLRLLTALNTLAVRRQRFDPHAREEPAKESYSKRPYYAVGVGRDLGIFRTWEECKEAVDRYSNAKYKSFLTRTKATKWLEKYQVVMGNHGRWIHLPHGDRSRGSRTPPRSPHRDRLGSSGSEGEELVAARGRSVDRHDSRHHHRPSSRGLSPTRDEIVRRSLQREQDACDRQERRHSEQVQELHAKIDLLAREQKKIVRTQESGGLASSRSFDRIITGLNIPESMCPQGFFADDLIQSCIDAGLQQKLDNSLDPRKVKKAHLLTYFGSALPGDPLGGLLADSQCLVLPAGVVSSASNLAINQFAGAIAERIGKAGGGSENARRNWPGDAKTEAVLMALCASIPRLRRLGKVMAQRQERERRRMAPVEGSLKAMFHAPAPLDPQADEYEKCKYRREQLALRFTRVFHAMFTYLEGACRSSPDPDTDKLFKEVIGVNSQRQVCAKAELIFKELMSLRRGHEDNEPLGLLVMLAFLERLERQGFGDTVIDAASLHAPDTSQKLDQLEASLGTNKDPTVMVQKTDKALEAEKAKNETMRKELAALKKKVDEKTDTNVDGLVKQLAEATKRLQRLEHSKNDWMKAGDNYDGGGRGGGGRGGGGRGKGADGRGGRGGRGGAAAAAADGGAPAADGGD